MTKPPNVVTFPQLQDNPSRRFEWDDDKEQRNIRKHRVNFDLASTAFYDEFALLEQDRIEGGEYRWRTLGMATGLLLLLVAHTVEDENGVEIIRIISARPADRKERKRYGENYQAQI